MQDSYVLPVGPKDVIEAFAATGFNVSLSPEILLKDGVAIEGSRITVTIPTEGTEKEQEYAEEQHRLRRLVISLLRSHGATSATGRTIRADGTHSTILHVFVPADVPPDYPEGVGFLEFMDFAPCPRCGSRHPHPQAEGLPLGLQQLLSGLSAEAPDPAALPDMPADPRQRKPRRRDN